ncbi:hypothetical protein [Streptomyces sp. NPDC051219]|uniref:hypothetical protein n=1 Tax=Streptomyces sp. NPDC051219 TaxID=3155283 RepID=UPI00341A7E71
MTAPHTTAPAPRLLTAAALAAAALATAGLFAVEGGPAANGAPRTDAPGALQLRPVALLSEPATTTAAPGVA